MDPLATQEPGLILDGLVSSCDDTAWRLHATSTAVGGRVGQTLAELALRLEEQSLELVSLRIPMVSRRFEAMYERGRPSLLLDGDRDRLALVGQCLERHARLVEAYQRATQMDLPASWAVLIGRHLDELLASRAELHRLMTGLPRQQMWALAETGR